MKTNCPNCGAPLNRNGECQYCGTIDREQEPEQPKVRSYIEQTPTHIRFVTETFANRDSEGRLHREQHFLGIELC